MSSWRKEILPIVLVVMVPATFAHAGEPDSSAAKPAKAATPAAFTFLVDANNCLTPEDGFFEPDGFSDFQLAVRDSLLPDSGTETILHVVVQASFEPPYSIRLERERGAPGSAKSLKLRLVRAKKNLWVDMMQEMQREQGIPISLAKKHQKKALTKVSRAVETKTLPVSQDLSDRLAAVWAGILGRTQYVNEVLVAPDGSGIGYFKADGTDYHFWHDRRSGTTHSPEEGSLLAAFVEVAGQLFRYMESPAEGRSEVEKTLRDQLSQLQTRIAANEPCLRSEPPMKAKHGP